MSWWATDVRRAMEELKAVAELEDRVAWLSRVNWRVVNNLQLVVDFDISHGDKQYPFTMAYPSLFPDTPPRVNPRDNRLLSAHQYGTGGELCLEWRPDNWDRAVTGALLIESAQRLIAGEAPTDSSSGVVLSAHQASIGRDSRGANMRFMVPAEAMGPLNFLELEDATPLTVWDRAAKPTWVAALDRIGTPEAPMWASNEPRPSTARPVGGFAIRTQRNLAPFATNGDAFLAALPSEFPALHAALSGTLEAFVLLGDGEKWLVFNLFVSDGKRHVFCYRTLVAPTLGGRLSASYQVLGEKRVAVVGAGSVGSKIAIGLARAGLRNFTLVDDDLLFVANLVRNGLDASGIGMHKVDALSAKIAEIVGGANVTCRRIALGQQESAGTAELVFDDLSKVDLLVDATADARAFNLIGAVARRQKKPMVWCQVFAGGIGGVIARVRPDIEPVPMAARDQIRAWCDSHGIPWMENSGQDYGAASDNGPLIADDAEVTVIAAHATRMVLDSLVNDSTRFPAPAYAIGMGTAWIFAAPFDTWPIALQPAGHWGQEGSEVTDEEVKDLIQALFPKAADA